MCAQKYMQCYPKFDDLVDDKQTYNGFRVGHLAATGVLPYITHTRDTICDLGLSELCMVPIPIVGTCLYAVVTAPGVYTFVKSVLAQRPPTLCEMAAASVAKRAYDIHKLALDEARTFVSEMLCLPNRALDLVYTYGMVMQILGGEMLVRMNHRYIARRDLRQRDADSGLYLHPVNSPHLQYRALSIALEVFFRMFEKLIYIGVSTNYFVRITNAYVETTRRDKMRSLECEINATLGKMSKIDMGMFTEIEDVQFITCLRKLLTSALEVPKYEVCSVCAVSRVYI